MISLMFYLLSFAANVLAYYYLGHGALNAFVAGSSITFAIVRSTELYFDWRART